MKKIGFTIGKFAPLHKGHEYLIEKALSDMDEFYVVVYETDLIDIPIEERANWIKQIYPSVNVILAKNPPMQYGLDETSVKIQTDYLKKIMNGIDVTHFFSSEPYGKFVARDFNVQNEIVDSNREKFHISATDIRSDIDSYSQYINKIVLNDIKNNIS